VDCWSAGIEGACNNCPEALLPLGDCELLVFVLECTGDVGSLLVMSGTLFSLLAGDWRLLGGVSFREIGSAGRLVASDMDMLRC